MNSQDRSVGLVSVIVPARNASTVVGCQVASLLRQNYAGTWELIVVDNGSVDGTGKLVEEIASTSEWPSNLERFIVDYYEDRAGYASPRNRGVEVSHGNWLAFCDADDEVGEGWLDALVRSRNPAVVNASAHRNMETGEPRILDELPTVLGHEIVPTGGLFCSRALLRELKGFDQYFDGGGEDTDFSIRAVAEAGARLEIVPDAEYLVRARGSNASVFRQSFGYAGNRVRVASRHKELLGIRPSHWEYLGRRFRDLIRKSPQLLTSDREQYLREAGNTLGMAVWSARLRIRHWEGWSPTRPANPTHQGGSSESSPRNAP